MIEYDNSENPSNEADAVLYIFLVRIANFLADTNRTTDGSILIKKILELEEKIGYADNAPIFIQDYVVFERLLFYFYYSTEAVEYYT